MKKIFTSILALIMLILSAILSLTAAAEDKQISYKSTIPYMSGESPVSISNEIYEYISDLKDKNYIKYTDSFFVIDNYGLCRDLGIIGKNKSFFNDNLIIINILSGIPKETRENTGVSIKDGIINVSYSSTFEYPIPAYSFSIYDFIELKKSDVKGIDLSKLIVNEKTKSLGIDGVWSENNTSFPLTYINLEKLIKKPERVTKVNTNSTKKNQLKVTWKKIKDVKYQVQYSLKKNMKKAKTKKNMTKNTVTLKKLKSGKKYYVRVRAYRKVGSKTYLGKWSKKAVKTVK